jgi:aspartyl-tRNA(Asn)/glutamyl-tRNA(Gln) amidotransferase subunit A
MAGTVGGMSISDLLDADALTIAEAVRARAVSAREVADAQLARIAERDGEIGAVWLVTEERAHAEAGAVDSALARGEPVGPLAGVPVGWKDLIDTGGIRTTYGSLLYRDHVPERDADVVARLAAAGAVTVAKLSLDELAWGTTNNNPHFGPCRNPHAPDRVPGGSSGGSAAALATGMVALAPGTDTGGSIRVPASCCGVIGFKPTYGRVSMAGIRPLAVSLDHCGPLARSVRDCAATLEAIAGASPRDPRTPPVPVEPYGDALGRGVDGLTIGVAERYFFEHATEEIVVAVRAALARLEGAGARLVEVDLGWPAPGLTRDDPYLPEDAAELAEHWPHRRADLSDEVATDVERGMTTMSALDAALAVRARLAFRTRASELVADAGIDLVATPTQPFTPPLIGTRTQDFAGRPAEDISWAMGGFTYPFNVLGWPAISVPCGTDAAGVPIGIQLAARPWREGDCLAAAATLESAAPPSSG